MFDQIIEEYIKSLKDLGGLETKLAESKLVQEKIALQQKVLKNATEGVRASEKKLANNLKLTGQWAFSEASIADSRKTISDTYTRIQLVTQQKAFVQERKELELEQDEITILLQRIEKQQEGLENREALVKALQEKHESNTKQLAEIEAMRHRSILEKLSKFYESGGHNGPERAIGRLQLQVLELEQPGRPPNETVAEKDLHAASTLLNDTKDDLENAGLTDKASETAMRLKQELLKIQEMGSSKAEEGKTIGTGPAEACKDARNLVEEAWCQRSRHEQDQAAVRDVLGQALASLDKNEIGQAAEAELKQASSNARNLAEMEDIIDEKLLPFDKIDQMKPKEREQEFAQMATGKEKEYLSLKEAKRKLAAAGNDFVQNYFLITGDNQLVKGPQTNEGEADETFLKTSNSATGDYNDPKNLGKYTYHLTALGNLIREDGGIIPDGLAPKRGGTPGGSSEIADDAKFMRVPIKDASFVNSENKVAVSSNRDEGSKVYIKQREDAVDELMKQQKAVEAARATSIMLRFPIRAEYLGKFGKDPVHLKENLELLDGTKVPPEDIEALVHRQWVPITNEKFKEAYIATLKTS